MNEPMLADSPETLARQYGRKVFMAAYRVLGNAAQAEDVQQDVFLRLVEAQPSGVDSWVAYLTASAVRSAIDLLRRHRRWGRVMALWRIDHAEAAESAEHSGINHERTQRLRNALARLPRREAQCFGLRYLQGMEIEDIARTLGLSGNNINVILHRARKRLEALLHETEEEISHD
ncbi:MAG: sigma-70 family RNA polymerase sigma factor [Rudaea sp.]